MPAATVILLREPHEVQGSPFEVFLARRHIKSDFAPDVYVFPGGKADSRDGVEGDFLTLGPLPNVVERDEPAVGWRAIYMAAVRELFEESGLLLAQRPNGDWATDGAGNLELSLSVYRDQIRSGSLSMPALAGLEGLTFAVDQLRLFSNWITPELLTKRFDTFFFLARLPDGSEVRLADEIELPHCLWICPAEALRRFRNGDFPLVYATERHLGFLAEFPDIDTLWQSCKGASVSPVSPRWLMREDEQIWLIPGDDDYESARVW